MPRPPRNWVVDALGAAKAGRLEAVLGEWPEVPELLLDYLEQAFPPRCYEGNESVEDHLLYAGQVRLVETMREAFNRQQQDGIELAEDV